MGAWFARQATNLHFLVVNAAFLSAYFIPVTVPVGLYAAWKGYIPKLVGGVLASALLLDQLIPMPKRPHWNKWYTQLTGIEAGMKQYCQGECKMEATFEKDRKYLIALAPHGLWTMAYHLLWPRLLEKFGSVPMLCGADVLLKIPIFRRHFAAFSVVGASKKDMSFALSQSHPFNVCLIVPGGIAEMFYGVTREQIILKKRKGFVKMALTHGCDLVPAYGFGTNQQYRRFIEAGGTLEKLSRKLQISIAPWLDKFYIPFGVIPTNHKVLLAVGKPIPVTKVENPSQEQIDELHEQFCKAMKDLFDRYKGDMGWQDKRLYFEDEKPDAKSKSA